MSIPPLSETSGATDRMHGTPSPKQDLFFAAAEALLLRFGYRKTTVEDVCREAGASKRTFYEHFTGKNDLVARLVMRASGELISKWSEGAVAGETASSQLGRYLDEFEKMSRNRPLFRISFLDRDLMDAFGSIAPELHAAPPFLVLRGILERGMKDQEFRSMDTEAMARMIHTLLDSTYFLMPDITHQPGPVEDPLLATQVKEFILNGVKRVGVVEG